LADLLAADTEAQRAQAVAAAGGAARVQCTAWRATLLRCLARVEAVIDFGEDDDIADDVATGVVSEIQSLRTELEWHVAAATRGELVREGVYVALVGAPNAGKSSLLNALAGRDVAIVSSMAGTTRDVLEVTLDLGGYKVVLTDGAGLRHAKDPVEAEGVRRAACAAAAAHIVVAMKEPGGRWVEAEAVPELSFTPPTIEREEAMPPSTVTATKKGKKPVLHVLSKSDLMIHGSGGPSEESVDCTMVSCVTGQGLAEFTARLASAVQHVIQSGRSHEEQLNMGSGTASPTILNRSRHIYHVSKCVEALKRYEAGPGLLEVAAEELREAAGALGKVTGSMDTEAVLDSIFEEFCIGK